MFGSCFGLLMDDPTCGRVYTEGSNEAGSVSRMLSSFHLSDKRAVESAVPQVALNAFAFLSESSAAQVYEYISISSSSLFDTTLSHALA